MPQKISIAKEDSVQEIKSKIGVSTDWGIALTTLFVKINYALREISDLFTKITNANMLKIDSIGEYTDTEGTTSSGTVFGKINEITDAVMSGDGIISMAAAGTDTIVMQLDNMPRTGSFNYYFRLSIGGKYVLQSSYKRGYIYLWALTGVENTIYATLTNTSNVVSTKSATISLVAGQWYRIYVNNYGTYTAQVNSLALYRANNLTQYSIYSNSAIPSNNVVLNLTPSSSSGTNTSFTTILTQTISVNGMVRVKFTAYNNSNYATEAKININNINRCVYDATRSELLRDVEVCKGDILSIDVRTDSSSTSGWRLTAVQICYDIVPIGVNPSYIKTMG